VHRGGRVAVAGRVLRVSTTFRRSVTTHGVRTGSPAHRAVAATLRTLASGELPSGGDLRHTFRPAEPSCGACWGTTCGSCTDSTRTTCSS
jgi:hypothetical protein